MYPFQYETKGTSNYIVYEADRDEKIDTLSLGMMTNNRIRGLLPVIYTQRDQVRYFKYNISSKVVLDQFFMGVVKKNQLIGAFKSIASALLEAEEYMIDISEIIMDSKYIYIDISTCEAELICIPVEEKCTQGNLPAFFKEILFASQFDKSENGDYVVKLMNHLNSSSAGDFPVFIKLLESLEQAGVNKSDNNKNSSFKNENSYHQAKVVIPEVKPVIKNEQKEIAGKSEGDKKWFLFGTGKKDKAEKNKNKGKDKRSKKDETAVGFSIPGRAGKVKSAVTVGENRNDDKVPISLEAKRQANCPRADFGNTTVLGNEEQGMTTVLDAMNSLQDREYRPYLLHSRSGEKVYLEKQYFRIGKEESYVDYVIKDNPAISRSHAEIRNIDGKCCISDTNSTNHTYLNDKMLLGNGAEELKDGDQIRLGDEEFQFHMG